MPCCGWPGEAMERGPFGKPGRRWARFGPAHRWPAAPFGFRRRFISREERIERLQQYLDALRREARAVEEAIEELKGKPSEPQAPAG